MAPLLEKRHEKLDARSAAHLLRRSGFGFSPDQREALVGLDAAEAARRVVEAATSAAPLQPPAWYGGDGTAEVARAEIPRTLSRDWLRRMHGHGLREKMTLFWHNHFVTQGTGYRRNPHLAYQYLETLQRNALGDFRLFVREIGLTPAMLYYLNGNRNHKADPNENYARELLELFTLGIGQYTEGDIVETARALTGYVVDLETLSPVFVPRRFDDGVKTIFGASGNFAYDDVVDLVFDRKADAAARFVCAKLYRFFVYQEAGADAVEALAGLFAGGGFAIAPVVEALLSSQAFYAPETVGAQIKSPVELELGAIHHAGASLDDDGFAGLVGNIKNYGQDLFYPPNVAGWPGHRSWISNDRLLKRWDRSTRAARARTAESPLVALAARMPAPDDPRALTRDLADFWLAVELSEAELDELTEVLLDGIPDYEWSIGRDGAANRLRNLFLHVLNLPEYQLC